MPAFVVVQGRHLFVPGLFFFPLRALVAHRSSTFSSPIPPYAFVPIACCLLPIHPSLHPLFIYVVLPMAKWVFLQIDFLPENQL